MDTMDANTQKIEAKRAKYREYYYNHHEHIINYRKESGVAQKSYQKYYGEKAEIIRAKNLARYHAKKAERLALERPPVVEPSINISGSASAYSLEDLPVVEPPAQE